MSSYESLLENYALEERFENITFAEMGSILESLTEFVDEEVNVTVEISLQEAEDESIKDKASKIATGVRTGISNIIKKLQEFISRLGESVKAFVAKAKKVIVDGGNVALSKAVTKNKSLMIKKKVTLIEYDPAAIKPLFTKANSAVKAINKIWGTFELGGNVPEIPSEVEDAREAFKQKLDKSTLGQKRDIEPGVNITGMYNRYVTELLKLVNTNLTPIQNGAQDAIAEAKNTIRKLKRYENQNDKNTGNIPKITALSSAAMQMNTYAINFAATVLTIATKNSAKLALASGISNVDKAKNNIKAAPEKIKSGANKIKDKLPKKGEKNEEAK